MSILNHVKTIFFDYDGTLHNSLKIYAPAFRKAYEYLVNNNLAEQRDWTEKEISHWLGMNPKEMWNDFMPELSKENRLKCSEIISEELNSLIRDKRPVLYEGSIEVLEYLKNKGYHLIFISNCKQYYLESQKQLFQLDRYFVDMVCSEQYQFIPKEEIIQMIKGNYPEEMVIIGDRVQDMEAGKKNGIYTIGCKYGYGEAWEYEQADILLEDIKDLMNLF